MKFDVVLANTNCIFHDQQSLLGGLSKSPGGHGGQTPFVGNHVL